MPKKFEIRNSTAEFLTFVAEGKEQGVQVLYKDETIWAIQKAMTMLFDCSTDNIGLHLKNIFKSGELEERSVTEKNSATAADGKNYMTKFYNLDAINIRWLSCRLHSCNSVSPMVYLYRSSVFVAWLYHR